MNKKIGTCSCCGRENVILTRGLCRKHYDQLRTYGKFLDNNPRTAIDPNEFIYNPSLNCYEIILYDVQSFPLDKTLIDVDDFDKCQGIKWYRNERGYCQGRMKGSKAKIRLSRFVMNLETGDKRAIIYRNGNKLDNRKSNLIVGEQRDISIYNASRRNSSSTGVNGVQYNCGHYEAYINYNGQKLYIGGYPTLWEATVQRRLAEEYFNNNKNFINPLYYSLPENYNIDMDRRKLMDRNNYIMHPESNICEMILYNRQCQEVGRAIIDMEDYEKCKDISWSLDPKGYCVGSYKGNKYRLHRYLVNCPDDMVVDHINRITFDNRKENLRITTPRVNAINTVSRPYGKSGIHGVRQVGNKFQATIGVKNQLINLGLYNTIEEAIQVRKHAEYEYGYTQLIAGVPIEEIGIDFG